MATKVRGAQRRPWRPLGSAAGPGGSGPGTRAAGTRAKLRGRLAAPQGSGHAGRGRSGARLQALEGRGAGPRARAGPPAKFAPELGLRPAAWR